jgi:hypothetical protein
MPPQFGPEVALLFLGTIVTAVVAWSYPRHLETWGARLLAHLPLLVFVLFAGYVKRTTGSGDAIRLDGALLLAILGITMAVYVLRLRRLVGGPEGGRRRRFVERHVTRLLVGFNALVIGGLGVLDLVNLVVPLTPGAPALTGAPLTDWMVLGFAALSAVNVAGYLAGAWGPLNRRLSLFLAFRLLYGSAVLRVFGALFLHQGAYYVALLAALETLSALLTLELLRGFDPTASPTFPKKDTDPGEG